MRTRRVRAAMAASALVGAMALVNCAGGTGASSAATDESAEDVKTIKLVAAEYSRDHTRAFWEAFADTYEEQSGYKLDVSIVSWDDIDQQSSTMIQNNQPPDILNLNAFANYAKDGLLYSSDEVLDPQITGDIIGAFVESGTYDGKFYGFPDLASARAFFFNNDIFDQAGVAKAPQTWAELEAAATKIKAEGHIGYAMPLGPEESQAEFSMWIFNNGGGWKTDDKWTINSPENVETLKFMRSMNDKGLTQNNPARTNRADAFDLFKSGEAGMVVGFSPLAAALDKDGDINYGVAPFPTNDGEPPRTLAVTDYLMAFKKPGNQEPVAAFYDLYYQTQQINTFIDREGFLPVTKSGLEYFSDNAGLKVYLDTLPKARLAPTDDPAWDKVKLDTQQTLGLALTDDPKSVLDALQRTATED